MAIETNSLKPCQAVARGKLRWSDALDEHYYICQADCPKYEHHAAERIGKGMLDGFVALMVERNVMHRLCKGCEEATDGKH